VLFRAGIENQSKGRQDRKKNEKKELKA